MGSFRFHPQDDAGKIVILSETKNPTLSRNYLLLLKAEGSFGAEAPQDDTAWHVILSEAPPVRRAGPPTAGRPSCGGQGRIPCIAISNYS